jgi:nucleotide-binding universal stress UspA family protein
MKIHHILFPTDFSDLGKATEIHVGRMAEHFGARVSVLYAIELPPAYYGVPGDFFMESVDAEKLQEQAEKTIQCVLPGMLVEREVMIGDPASLIAEFAEMNNVDLIMMPTHGYGPFRRALIGSVTAKVLHDARCAVWTTAHAEEPADGNHNGYQKLICAIDLTPESLHVIRETAALSQSFGANVWLAHAVAQVHSIRDEFGMGPTEWAMNLQDFYMDHARREIARMQAEAGTSFPVCLHPGPVAAVMGEVVRRHQADLLITGRGEIQHFLGSVRSHAYPIIHESPCPVLSL